MKATNIGMSVSVPNLAPDGLQVKEYGVAVCNKSSLKKTGARSTKRGSFSTQRISTVGLRERYKFWILLGILILAGIAIIMRIETAVVWTFLYCVGGWAALTNNPVKKSEIKSLLVLFIKLLS